MSSSGFRRQRALFFKGSRRRSAGGIDEEGRFSLLGSWEGRLTTAIVDGGRWGLRNEGFNQWRRYL